MMANEDDNGIYDVIEIANGTEEEEEEKISVAEDSKSNVDIDVDDIEAQDNNIIVSQSQSSSEELLISREKSVRFRPDMMYSRRQIMSGRRQVFQKAKTVTQDGQQEQSKYTEAAGTSTLSFASTQKFVSSEYKPSRECYVQVVSGLRDAMDPKLRRRKEFGKRIVEDLDDSVEIGPNTQYRLTSISGSGGGQIREKISYDPSKLGCLGQLGFNAYVHWSYRASFFYVVLSLTMIFFAFVTFFGLLIYILGGFQPECFYVGSLDKDFQQAGSHFIDAFAISWTTFSTVVSVFLLSILAEGDFHPLRCDF
jgi:hypothetical protein